MMLKRKTLKRKIPNNKKTLYNAWEITDKLSPHCYGETGLNEQ